MSAVAARPTYSIGQTVRYRDHHNRMQVGRVDSIEANWHSWSTSGLPSIIYDLRHPTYRNNRCYRGEDNILGPSTGIGT
jgi:hypothetical protein